MDKKLPGTVLTCPPDKETDAFAVLQPIFAVSGGGLLLSQVAELTGLTPTTIQNWVKRGWVEGPVAKKYDEIRVARILLIHLLRASMPLERITHLLTYVNGRVDDRTDDVLPDPQLYSLVCRTLFRLQDGAHDGRETLQPLIEEQLRGLPHTAPDAGERLLNALEIVVLSAEAALRIRQAEERYEQTILKEGAR